MEDKTTRRGDIRKMSAATREVLRKSAEVKHALLEAGEFLAAHEPYAGTREIRCITPFSEEMPGMSLATVRALYALAVPRDVLTAAERAVQVSNDVRDRLKKFEHTFPEGTANRSFLNAAISAAIRSVEEARTAMVEIRAIEIVLRAAEDAPDAENTAGPVFEPDVNKAAASQALTVAITVMRNAPTGQRGRTLHHCASILGIHGAAGRLTEDAVWDALREAAVDHRMSEEDARGTFLSGWEAGLKAARP